jgi:hypothetical protein
MKQKRLIKLGIILLFILLVILYIYSIYKKECYSRKFPPLIASVHRFYNIAVTPLKPLESPIVKYKPGMYLPEIFIYNSKYLTPVRDQGRCGACWAFVIAGLLADCVTIRIIKFSKNLNVQQLLSCYKEVPGCDGAAPEDVLIWLEKTGFKISIDDQYLQSVSKCTISNKGISVQKNSVSSLCTYLQDESIINPTKEQQDILKQNIYAMKVHIRSLGPIYSSISVYNDFFRFKGDRVYSKKSDEFIGGHAVEIVGWCDAGVDLRQKFRDGYWVCKNSWGKKWASSYDFPGYFAIKMGTNECGIESRTGAADPNVEYLLRDDKFAGEIAYTSYKELLEYLLEKNKFMF